MHDIFKQKQKQKHGYISFKNVIIIDLLVFRKYFLSGFLIGKHDPKYKLYSKLEQYRENNKFVLSEILYFKNTTLNPKSWLQNKQQNTNLKSHKDQIKSGERIQYKEAPNAWSECSVKPN